MSEPPDQDPYCTALEQIKEMLAKYRPDITHLRQRNSVFSPRLLTLMIEGSTTQTPPGVLERLRPLAEAVLHQSEVGIADMAGFPPLEDLRSEIQARALAAYEKIQNLHAEVMTGS